MTSLIGVRIREGETKDQRWAERFPRGWILFDPIGEEMQDCRVKAQAEVRAPYLDVLVTIELDVEPRSLPGHHAVAACVDRGGRDTERPR